MAIIGTYTDRKNPDYTIDDFTFWIPKFANFMKTDQGVKYFNKIYPIVNNKVFYSIFGTDWEMAMSYAIAHYLTLIGKQISDIGGNSLEAAASGQTMPGVLTSVSVGSFSKSYDFDATMTKETEAMFWNQTSYGLQFYALLKSKPMASICVVTDGNPYENRIDDSHNDSMNPCYPWRTKFNG